MTQAVHDTLSDHHFQQRRVIRRRMRDKRRQLPAWEREEAAWRLERHLQSQIWFARANRIGLYLPNEGELDVLPAVLGTHRRGRSLFLPVLRNRHHMSFCRWIPGEPLVENRFGIPEPQPARQQPVANWSLDVLLLPLVAFDAHGNRLGMGGGFYDRTLAQLINRPRRPRLIGIGYRFQEVDALPVAPWDRRLDEVITD
ncbi:MAG: 5-formyltetrahydrofolate cyclo-ligase [Alcanivoracaceae bacterium]|nr:5-formyltetrahydrofolate cyclo-ligase [Alcanivoracaceae bacterium]